MGVGTAFSWKKEQNVQDLDASSSLSHLKEPQVVSNNCSKDMWEGLECEEERCVEVKRTEK